MDCCCVAANKKKKRFYTSVYSLYVIDSMPYDCFNTSLPVFICQSMFVCKQTFVNGLFS